MPKYRYWVYQTIGVVVDVEATSPDAAEAKLDQRDFPLPPRDEWQSVKGSFEYELDHQLEAE